MVMLITKLHLLLQFNLMLLLKFVPFRFFKVLNTLQIFLLQFVFVCIHEADTCLCYRYLIDAGANVNAQTSTGDTALTYACENGHTDVADLLLQAGANLVRS